MQLYAVGIFVRGRWLLNSRMVGKSAQYFVFILANCSYIETCVRKKSTASVPRIPCLQRRSWNRTDRFPRRRCLMVPQTLKTYSSRAQPQQKLIAHTRAQGPEKNQKPDPRVHRKPQRRHYRSKPHQNISTTCLQSTIYIRHP